MGKVESHDQAHEVDPPEQGVNHICLLAQVTRMHCACHDSADAVVCPRIPTPQNAYAIDTSALPGLTLFLLHAQAVVRPGKSKMHDGGQVARSRASRQQGGCVEWPFRCHACAQLAAQIKRLRGRINLSSPTQDVRLACMLLRTSSMDVMPLVLLCRTGTAALVVCEAHGPSRPSNGRFSSRQQSDSKVTRSGRPAPSYNDNASVSE